jgi:hypothetical protein
VLLGVADRDGVGGGHSLDGVQLGRRRDAELLEQRVDVGATSVVWRMRASSRSSSTTWTLSSTLIYGKRDAVLVDTFMTVDQNDVLIDWVKGSGKNLAAGKVGVHALAKLSLQRLAAAIEQVVSCFGAVHDSSAQWSFAQS